MRIKGDKKDTRFTAILVLVHAIGFLLACRYTRIYMGDSFEYIYEALNIKHHFFFYSGAPAMPVRTEYMTLRPPGYPLFLLLVYGFTVNNWIVLVLQNALSIFNILYLRRVLLHCGYQKKYDWLLLVFIVAYPAQLIFANTIAPDILLQTFAILYFCNFLNLLQKKRNEFAFVMSLALTAGMLVKPILYPFVVVHLVLLVVYAVYRKTGRLSLVMIATLPLVATLLYNSWNYERTGKFHFSSIQPINALYYNCYLFYMHRDGMAKAREFVQAEKEKIAAMPQFKDRYEYADARSLQILKSNLVPYGIFHARESLRFFIEPGKGEMDLFTGKLTYGRLYGDKSSGFYATLKRDGMAGMKEYFSNNPSMIAVLIVLFFNCLRAAGIILFLFSRRIAPGIRLSALLFLCYFALMTGPIANTRYFLPVSLISISCAVMGFMPLLQKHKNQTDPERGAV